jgi:hypothetical protein
MAEATPLVAWLEADHRAIDDLLARAAAGEGPLDREAYAAFRARLLRHIAIEEKVLLPAAQRARHGVALERALRLRTEHAAITSLLVPTPDRALVGELRALLVPHDLLEEGPGGVYAECAALIGEGWPEVLERAVAYPEVKAARHVDGARVVRTAGEALARARARRT